MEVLERKAHKTIPYKQGVFNINSKEQKGDKKQVSFNYIRHDDKKVIVIKSPLLEKDNFNVVHAGAIITLIISEKKRIDKPIYVHNVEPKHYDFTEYEKLKSFEHYIPDDYFVHIDTKWNERNKTVEVYFR